MIVDVQIKAGLASPDRTKKIHWRRSVLTRVLQLNFMNAHPCVRPTFVKQTVALALLVLIPVTNQFGSEYQLLYQELL